MSRVLYVFVYHNTHSRRLAWADFGRDSRSRELESQAKFSLFLSRSDHGHEDSTINIVVDYYYYY